MELSPVFSRAYTRDQNVVPRENTYGKFGLSARVNDLVSLAFFRVWLGDTGKLGISM